MKKKIIHPADLTTGQLYKLFVSTVAPRPIAFVSTIDEAGNANLAPYSFFNVFSTNPPIMIFSSNRRVSDNTTKDTLANVMATREAVINIVSYDIVRQMAVSSVSFAPEVNEFEKSGLTPMPSELVRPFRVAESPVNFECKVRDIITLGDQGGAGHLVLCDVVNIHVAEHIFDDNGKVDPQNIDLVGRMGRAFYTRTRSDIFKVYQPASVLTIGYDQLPAIAKNSKVLTGNDLGALAGLPNFPASEVIQAVATDERVQVISSDSQDANMSIEHYAQELIQAEQIEQALAVLMYADQKKLME